MYIFEGRDYKQDVAVLQDILVESKDMEPVRNISVEQGKHLKMPKFLAR